MNMENKNTNTTVLVLIYSFMSPILNFFLFDNYSSTIASLLSRKITLKTDLPNYAEVCA